MDNIFELSEIRREGLKYEHVATRHVNVPCMQKLALLGSTVHTYTLPAWLTSFQLRCNGVKIIG